MELIAMWFYILTSYWPYRAAEKRVEAGLKHLEQANAFAEELVPLQCNCGADDCSYTVAVTETLKLRRTAKRQIVENLIAMTLTVVFIIALTIYSIIRPN